MKIAHLSDLHFFVTGISFKNLFSKKVIGKATAIFHRKDFFITKYLDRLLATLIKEGVEAVLISGDFTTTSDVEEFLLAKEFIEDIEGCNIKVFIVPGNHDVYTKKAYDEKIFYNILSPNPAISLNGWDMLLLDTTMDNPPFFANGKYRNTQQEQVENFLKRSKNAIILNHFPLDDPKEKHKLIHGKKLKEMLLAHVGNILYLHGHTHKTSYKKLSDHLHVFNSSESTVKGKFTFHIIDLQENSFTHKEVKYFK